MLSFFCSQTGAKIIIRGKGVGSIRFFKMFRFVCQGKGSVKDGKMGLVKHGPMPGEDEPLHAFITGMTQEMVTKAAEKVSLSSERQLMRSSMLLSRYKKSSTRVSMHPKD